LIRTGIFKVPVQGKAHVDALNLAGDQQGDLIIPLEFSSG